MTNLFLVAILTWAATVWPARAQTAEESIQIQVLQSDAAPADKEDACRRLKLIGTAKSVPALAQLLTDEHLYQSACDALETMPAAEAGQALHASLRSTAGQPRTGIIHSLGERRYQRATADLGRLLSDPDSATASSAARALGRIGGDDAMRPLQQYLTTAAEPVRSAVVDALLDCAVELLASGNRDEARLIFRQFNDPKESANVRTAAYSGLIRAEQEHALDLVVSGLAGTDAAKQTAALGLAVEIQDPNAAAAFTKLLPQASPPLQIALLRLLQHRGDASAAPAVFSAAQSQDVVVRTAAIAALGTLGDATTITLLANAATSRDASEQEAARRALTELRRGDVADTMIAQLSSASPGVQMELIRALTERRDRGSASRLLEMSQTGNAEIRRTALSGLEQLADGSHLPALVELLEHANDEVSRAEVQSVFRSLSDRTPAGQKLNVSSIAKGFTMADVPTRIALLQVSAFFADPRLRDAFRDALQDADPQVRAAAGRALCDSRDTKLMPDLAELAKTATNLTLHALALEGYVRLVGEDDVNFPIQRRVRLLRSAYNLATRPEEKWLILSTLATAPNLESLQLAQGAVAELEVRTEAELASARIAAALLSTEPTAATTCLRRLAGQGSTSNVQADAQSILKEFDSGWLYAGPHGRKGHEGMELFDIAFAPERREVDWRRAPGTADVSRPGEVDLLKVANRDHCVLYLKTRVFAPIAQPVLFQIGSDDGIKLWVNGEVVHANNTTRGLTPGEDRVAGTLRPGWNDLFAKVTQVTAGYGLVLNIFSPDGSEISGLRFDPRGETPAADATGFQKVQLSDQFYAEGAFYGDFNGDGKRDVVAGPFWFEGPDFTKRHEYRPAKAFDPHGYSDNFLTYTADFNADGWLDVFCVPLPGAEGYWYENPRGREEHWQRHLASPMVGNESPGWVDVNGDRRPDLIFNNDGYLGYATHDPAKPYQPWTFHAVSPQDDRFQRFTHGIGAGDVNGDGRMDLVEATGWWEQPVSAAASAVWSFHPHPFSEAASQMLVTDVDGDGLTDVICSWHCHRYGLVWYRQLREVSGRITWEQNVILPPAPDLSLDTLRFSQLHAMDLVDMNGDGLKDVLTGKRFWAHGPAGDVEPDAPAVLFWFELQRDNGKASFIPHLIDADSGVGTQVAAADLNGDQRPDVIVANKKGSFIHLSDRPKP